MILGVIVSLIAVALIFAKGRASDDESIPCPHCGYDGTGEDAAYDPDEEVTQHEGRPLED